MLKSTKYSGRPYKMLTVLDEYTREALCVHVCARMGSADVLGALYPLLLKHGKPDHIRSDNGPECIAAGLQDWFTKMTNNIRHRLTLSDKHIRFAQLTDDLLGPTTVCEL